MTKQQQEPIVSDPLDPANRVTNRTSSAPDTLVPTDKAEKEIKSSNTLAGKDKTAGSPNWPTKVSKDDGKKEEKVDKAAQRDATHLAETLKKEGITKVTVSPEKWVKLVNSHKGTPTPGNDGEEMTFDGVTFVRGK